METTSLAYTKNDDIVSDLYHEWGSEIDSLLGEWENVDPNTGQINRVKVLIENDKVVLHCFGKVDEGEQDWGKSPCELFSANVQSTVIEGFTCVYDFGFMSVNISGNMKYGVMVIQSYNAFNDGSKRNNYFSREFFVPLIKNGKTRGAKSPQLNLSHYLGTWNNSYEKSRLIESFTFFEDDGELKMSIENSRNSSYQGDWGKGKVSVHSYAPDLNDIVAFQARFHFDDMEMVLALNENKGLIIIAGYIIFNNEAEKSDYFVREFFHKI